MFVRHGDFRLTEEPPHEPDPFLSTYIVAILFKGIIIQNCAIAA
jgi:hypothetical protein